MPIELIELVKESDDVIDVGTETIIEAMNHLSDFCRGRDVWQRDTVKETCYDIGEEIYDKEGMEGLEDVYREVRYGMGPIAARYLEHFWNGVGNGAWRG